MMSEAEANSSGWNQDSRDLVMHADCLSENSSMQKGNSSCGSSLALKKKLQTFEPRCCSNLTKPVSEDGNTEPHRLVQFHNESQF